MGRAKLIKVSFFIFNSIFLENRINQTNHRFLPIRYSKDIKIGDQMNKTTLALLMTALTFASCKPYQKLACNALPIGATARVPWTFKNLMNDPQATSSGAVHEIGINTTPTQECSFTCETANTHFDGSACVANAQIIPEANVLCQDAHQGRQVVTSDGENLNVPPADMRGYCVLKVDADLAVSIGLFSLTDNLRIVDTNEYGGGSFLVEHSNDSPPYR